LASSGSRPWCGWINCRCSYPSSPATKQNTGLSTALRNSIDIHNGKARMGLGRPMVADTCFLETISFVTDSLSWSSLSSIFTSSRLGFRFNHPNIVLTCLSPKMNPAFRARRCFMRQFACSFKNEEPSLSSVPRASCKFSNSPSCQRLLGAADYFDEDLQIDMSIHE